MDNYSEVLTKVDYALDKSTQLNELLKKENSEEKNKNTKHAEDRKSTRLNSSHIQKSRMPSSA